MRLELINSVKENEYLGKSILSNEGTVLLRAGVKLTSTYINRLKNLGVLYVYVEDERLADVEVEDERLFELKSVTLKSMSSVIKSIHDCNGKKLRDSLSSVENLVNYIIDTGDVNNSLFDIKTHDNYTYMHSLDTCIMSTFLGVSANLDRWEMKDLAVGAILHDIGKTKIDAAIINKPGKLTPEEYDEMKKHPAFGGEMLRKNYSISDIAVNIVEQHHERVDGKGYPLGLCGNSISKYAKIVCICDVYDAVSNNRSYRAKFKPNDAYELILSGSGTSFDEKMICNFKNTFAIFPLGCKVKLSNGEEGYVIRQNKGFPDRPVIRIFKEVNGADFKNYTELDLLGISNIVIECIA